MEFAYIYIYIYFIYLLYIYILIKSGITADDIDRPFNIENFTIIIDINAQNLITSSLVELFTKKNRKDNTYSNIMTKNINFNDRKVNDKNNDYQPVFLTLAFSNGFFLEFSITTKDSLNHVTVDLLNESRNLFCKESFKYKIEEFKWYNLIITKPIDQKYVKIYKISNKSKLYYLFSLKST